ncbi:DUF370 domain-containing protein [Mitsuokella sp. AF21-1AC]|nr:DUF370 domain-containing protein [Mitsuokella sp. AF21-1AC]
MSVMFLHLGNGASVRTKDIIAIYDYEMFRDGDNARFLERRRREGRVLRADATREMIKSLVITPDKMYLSVISPATLRRRSRQIFDMDTSE